MTPRVLTYLGLFHVDQIFMHFKSVWFVTSPHCFTLFSFSASGQTTIWNGNLFSMRYVHIVPLNNSVKLLWIHSWLKSYRLLISINYFDLEKRNRFCNHRCTTHIWPADGNITLVQANLAVARVWFCSSHYKEIMSDIIYKSRNHMQDYFSVKRARPRIK